jgi:pimeloyl-ACP methyl ester carboxylesterase
MNEPFPIVLVPGLNCSARLYGEQIPALWRFGPVMVADHRRDQSMPAIARRILASAPPRFALVGLSMGGYIALEIVHQAPERVARLAVLDANARADTPERSENRRGLIAMAQSGRFADVTDIQFPMFVHRRLHGDVNLKAFVRTMAEETGAEAFVRQQTAIINRADARPLLASIACPTLVLVGDGDLLTPPELAQEIVDGIRGARLVVVPDCGHLSTVEQPEAVNRALIDWLEWN